MSNLRLILVIIGLIFSACIFLTSPKEEKLTCDVSKKICNLETRNYLNYTSTEFVINPYDVADVKTYEYKVTERYYGRHRTHTYKSTRYGIYFITNSGKRVLVFKNYSRETVADLKKNELIEAFKRGNNIIEVKR